MVESHSYLWFRPPHRGAGARGRKYCCRRQLTLAATLSTTTTTTINGSSACNEGENFTQPVRLVSPTPAAPSLSLTFFCPRVSGQSSSRTPPCPRRWSRQPCRTFIATTAGTLALVKLVPGTATGCFTCRRVSICDMIISVATAVIVGRGNLYNLDFPLLLGCTSSPLGARPRPATTTSTGTSSRDGTTTATAYSTTAAVVVISIAVAGDSGSQIVGGGRVQGADMKAAIAEHIHEAFVSASSLSHIHSTDNV